jgi:cytochrome c
MRRLCTCVFLAVAIMAAARIGRTGETALASPDPVLAAQAAEQLERGKTVYANTCARCHGDSGQGSGDYPRLVGTPNRMATYETAARLHAFVSSEMPGDAPKSLKPEEYWDVVAFLLNENKLLPASTVLGPDNAATIRTDRSGVSGRRP